MHWEDAPVTLGAPDGPELLLAAYAILNIAAFLLYGQDKRKAERGRWRTSERALLAAAALGPFGAYAGMHRFRHKTQKTKFALVPCFLLLHIAGLGYLAYLLIPPALF